jgi:hypothetical protein
LAEPAAGWELEILRERVAQILGRIRRLRAENENLRLELAQAREGDRTFEATRGEEARRKLVTLLERLQEI